MQQILYKKINIWISSYRSESRTYAVNFSHISFQLGIKTDIIPTAVPNIDSIAINNKLGHYRDK